MAPESPMRSYEDKLKIYKPNKTGTGGAIQLDLNVQKRCVFLEAAAQKAGPEQAFDWPNKIVFKLSETDISKIISVFDNRVKSTNIFHDPGKSKFVSETDVLNSAIAVAKGDYGYFFKASTQSKAGGLRAVQIPISEDEAVLLSTILKHALVKISGW
ncbi:MAG: hypothetical protein WC792_01135 [Candidatus Micrarchaeia archaeon]|jgi:hypothetical protein